jgi:hypothetical protein
MPTSTASTTTTGAVASSGSTGDQSGSFGRKIEFSSSFDKYKSSPTNRTALGDSPSSASMMRRWSRTSDHSSILWRNEHDEENDDLKDFVRLVGSNQELRLFQQHPSLLSSASESSTSSSMMNSSSVNKKSTALSHFQNLRETHNSLSDSLSSSVMLGTAASLQQQQQEPITTGISPVSSTSSTGRSYQPIIPSPLHHTEQHSTSPVHIPRSYPQLRSMTHTPNPLRIARLNTSSQPTNNEDNNEKKNGQGEEEEDTDAIMMYGARARDMPAYSTYPQDKHHQTQHRRNQQDLHHALRDVHPTSHRNPATGSKAADKLITDQIRQDSSRSSDSHDLYRSRNTAPSGEDTSFLMADPSGSNVTCGGGGGSSGNRGNNSSLMDDDDSLVFKMSELECETPSSFTGKQPPAPQKHEMLFNNRFNNTNLLHHSAPVSPNMNANNRVNEQFLELTPTPLSPPLLNRLQTISMSTVAEEEEKSSLSASGSSNKSESHSNAPTSGAAVAKPSPLPFDTW